MKDQTKIKYDAFLEKASWINGEPSPEMLRLCHAVSNDMLLAMWSEFLAFTEGMAKEVYEMPVADMLERMGSVELLSGFVAYAQGAIDTHLNETKGETNV